jgi:hypothetical protein
MPWACCNRSGSSPRRTNPMHSVGMDQEPDPLAGVGKPRSEGGQPVSEEMLGSTQDIDETKVEAFAEQMLGVLNDAMLALMTSIGHQTGLFDTMADLRPRPAKRLPRGRSSRSVTCASGSERWSSATSSPTTLPGRPTDSRRSMPPASHAPPAPTTLPTSHSSLRCSATSKKVSSRASATVAACPTPRTRDGRS